MKLERGINNLYIQNNTMGVTTVFLYVVIIHRFQAHDTLSMDMTYNKRC